MIKVLVVEDSAVVRELLVHLLGSDPEMHVVGSASNGEEALEAVKGKRPDIITMDIHMPKMDGLEATRRIMETIPTPIVVVSGSSNPYESEASFRAIEAGALAMVQKPRGWGHPAHDASAKELIQTVKLMSEVRVVRRWARHRAGEEPLAVLAPRAADLMRMPEPLPTEIKLVAIGASTGGPPVIQTIFSLLPKRFSVPIVIVQHMAPGFIEGFAEWLAQSCRFPVHVSAHGEQLLAGHVYVAPDGFQMRVEHGARMGLSQDEPENGLRPSVSYLFRSVARVYGPKAIGVLLTGMGKDGANELKLMKKEGALTLVQNKESSVVHGMPGEAIRLDASTYVLSPEAIAAALSNLANQSSG